VMDMDSMSVVGVKRWTDDKDDTGANPTWISKMHVPLTGSAHPLMRPGTSSYVDVVVESPMASVFGHSIIDLYTFEGNTANAQARQRFASIRVDANQYFHSYGVTPNYVVLPLNLQMKMPNPLAVGPLMQLFAAGWKGIYLVDYTGKTQVFETEPFFHTHIINSFENDTGVVLDVGCYHGNPFGRGPLTDISLALNKTYRDAYSLRAVVRRLHFHLTGPLQGKTTTQDFPTSGRSPDFFKVNMARSGLPYCIYYAVEWWHDGETLADIAILKHDLCKGTRKYWSRPATYPGEPFFVAGTSNAEDDGALVFIALDGRRRHSIFVTLDARTMEELQVVDLPVHIPFTGHGHFVPQREPAHEVIV